MGKLYLWLVYDKGMSPCPAEKSTSSSPSEVAAAIALAILGKANKQLIDNVLNHCVYMEKDKVMKCYEVIQDMRLVEMRSSLVSMAPQTQFRMLMWKVDFSIFTSFLDSRNL
ncbi:hypothetical protein HPP92_027715 [Vanilla planifolia]|uniref:Cyclin C-terminal domain-containing protein n=1 Tax=Vanilla planifolia TaxID=51239 RepID=A0A835PA06_VANPL|nr:hypothetical protein HPP92_027715 [Vanilla planifolia]